MSTVDRLLSSIAPHTLVKLQPGTYDLAKASDYGQARDVGWYTWEETYDGYQLVVHDLEDFAIVGSGQDEVTVAAVSRYAQVLSFRRCANVLIMGLTAGHIPQEAVCTGGVLSFDDCRAAQVAECGLFGCGIIGVSAQSTQNLSLRDTEIYACSYGAVEVSGCYNVQLDSCRIRNCGDWMKYGYNARALLSVSTTTGFAVVNSDITDNDAMCVLDCRYSQQVYLLGCGVSDNRLGECVFSLENAAPVVDGCAFTGNISPGYYPEDYSGYAVDPEGNDLISFDLSRMQRRAADFPGIAQPEKLQLDVTQEDGRTVYHVSTVDEFLAALGPDSTIYLEGELFDLTAAASYGGFGGSWYYWTADYDGPTLVISGVSHLRIVGQGKDKTTLLTQPRYADVLRFQGGEDIVLEGFTAGHTESGTCAGDVLAFQNVQNVEVRDCGLYGCGVWAIRCENCRDVRLTDDELYSCSAGALSLYGCSGVEMNGLDIHDMPEKDTAWIYDCAQVSYNGKTLANGTHGLW